MDPHTPSSNDATVTGADAAPPPWEALLRAVEDGLTLGGRRPARNPLRCKPPLRYGFRSRGYAHVLARRPLPPPCREPVNHHDGAPTGGRRKPTMTAAQLYRLSELAAEAADYFAGTDPAQARSLAQAARAARRLAERTAHQEHDACPSRPLALWPPASGRERVARRTRVRCRSRRLGLYRRRGHRRRNGSATCQVPSRLTANSDSSSTAKALPRGGCPVASLSVATQHRRRGTSERSRL